MRSFSVLINDASFRDEQRSVLHWLVWSRIFFFKAVLDM